MTRATLVVVLLVCAAVLPALRIAAQDDSDVIDLDQPEGRGMTDEMAIKDLADQWGAAWNRHDPKALASLLAEDAEFLTVEFQAVRYIGRKEFLERHAAKHKTWYAASVWRRHGGEVKFLRPDLALLHLSWSTKGDKVPHRKHGELREGVFTWIVEKRDGKWVIIRSQETESMPALPGQGPN